MRLCSLLLYGCISVLLFLTVFVLADADTELTEVKLMNLLYSPEESTKPQIRAVLEGFMSVFSNAGNVTADGRKVTLVELPDGDEGRDVVTSVQNVLAAHPDLLALIGPYSDGRLGALMYSGVLQTNSLVAVSPITGSSAVRVPNDHVYFLRADPLTETLVMIQYITATLNAQRVGYMYLQNLSFGDKEFVTVKQQLASMGRQAPIVYASVDNLATTVDEEKFDSFAEQRPQAIIVFGIPGPHTAAFIQKCVTDSRTHDATILASAGLTDTVFEAYSGLKQSNASFVPKAKQRCAELYQHAAQRDELQPH
ncbi:hypothetical protein AGDE_09695 [Angomonas deanei]|uniref:Periplasmic binding protein, putative n=1 Tax=Angomonas deanei TaxID=59799 RepID=A0A7G2CPK6_9TRYP|nr:hypothetical protein AGDE_09695 [Angomonas deanei]CAD2221768.1 Periplasmic binding protein, putative [Angomonas deanei]|eukprot:EPY29936.1 hypothetical protein AGDE_09695 [Angomonas deanei]